MPVMGDPNRIRDAFRAASQFLDPVLNREELNKSPGKSLLEILSQNLSVSADSIEALRLAVIGNALRILSEIHLAFATTAEVQTEQSLAQDCKDEALEDAKRRRMLHTLLDLISLEGIYPSLSSGVGIPLQQRVISVLPAGVIAKQAVVLTSSTPHNRHLLEMILGSLLDIVLDTRSSIQLVVRGRILSDLISGTADLAFNPNLQSYEGRAKFQKGFNDVVNGTPSAVLLPTLSSFLQSDTTEWFKATVSTQISRVPLRAGGVLQTIMFIASQFAPSLGKEAQTEPSNGPHFTVQAIIQISRLLSSVPHGIEAQDYFKVIAPQLLALLDGDDPDLKKTASYVIGSGILGKRAFGAPSAIGHSIFVEPIFGALTARLSDVSGQWMKHFSNERVIAFNQEKRVPFDELVDGYTVSLAIDRLRSLTLQHPNPALVKRIIYPILVPLWGFACFSKEQGITGFHEKVMALLQTYFAISVGMKPFKKLVDNLLWDGGAEYTFSVASQGQVSLTRRADKGSDQSNIVALVDSLQIRAELFVSLLGSDPSSEECIGDIFLYASEIWLVKSHGPKDSISVSRPQGVGGTENIVRKLVSAKISEKLLENFRETLTRRPLRVLELIGQVIDGERSVQFTQATRRREQQSGNPTLSSLANIVSDDNQSGTNEPDQDVSESLSTAFSLLSTVLASPDFSISEDTKHLLESIKGKLDQLIPLLPAALSKPATTSSMLLEIQLTSQERDDTRPPPAHISDLETHRQALANLASELPPVQAEGFSLLSKLIINSSPVLDIPSTLTLFMSIITDASESTANEEFIYLNAIKLIGILASRHPRTVVKTLVDSYADKSEKRTLDQRLKIGQSLLRTVQDLGEALTGETAKILGEGMIAVAGRRGLKPQAQRNRRQREANEQLRREREKRKQKEPAMPAGWSISSGPSVSKYEIGHDSHEDSDQDLSADESPENAANIVAAWAAGASADEEPDDLRVRASALSILASAVQTNVIGLGAAIVSSAIDLALATLTLEPSPEGAILRRAGTVLILDIVKAMDTARERRNGKDIGFGFSLADEIPGRISGSYHGDSRGTSTVGTIPSMLRTLGFVESRETDSIARGHLRVLIESLEAWLEKSLMAGIGAQSVEGDAIDSSLSLGDRIAGLSVNPLAGRNLPMGPRIEELE